MKIDSSGMGNLCNIAKFYSRENFNVYVFFPHQVAERVCLAVTRPLQPQDLGPLYLLQPPQALEANKQLPIPLVSSPRLLAASPPSRLGEDSDRPLHLDRRLFLDKPLPGEMFSSSVCFRHEFRSPFHSPFCCVNFCFFFFNRMKFKILKLSVIWDLSSHNYLSSIILVVVNFQ